MKTRWGQVCLLAMACACVGSEAWAREWFVSPGGTGTGTSAAPFGRIQQALDAAQPGDVITVAAGTYTGALSTIRNGSATAPIRLRAAGSRGSVLVTAAGRVLSLNHSHHIVEGLVLDGQYGMDDVVRVYTAGHYTQLRNLEVRRSTRDLVDIAAARNVLIEGALIHHALNAANGRTDAHGIVAGAVTDLTIRNTEIHTFSGDGFQVDPGRSAPGWNRVLIEGCRIWQAPLTAAANGFAAGALPGENAVDTKAGATVPRASITIRNTVAFGFRDSALMTNAAAFNLKENIDAVVDRVTVSNSQIAFRSRGPSSSTPMGAWVTVANAVVHNVAVAFRYENNIEKLRILNTTLGRGIATPFNAASSNNAGLEIRNLLVLGTLPSLAASASNMAATASAFVNAAGDDYRLTAGAVAVDTGITLPEVTVDRDGTARPQGAAFDVGAFERAASAVATPDLPAEEIVRYASALTALSGSWWVRKDGSAAGGFRVWHPDRANPVIPAPLPEPLHYFEVTVTVTAGVPYRFWLRGVAEKNSPSNDAVYVQFSGAVADSGGPIYRIGTDSAIVISLADCAGCGLSGWGWQDTATGMGILGPTITFAETGSQTIRIQTREDGFSIDQVVLSPSTYLHAAPGLPRNDTTILQQGF